MCIENFRFFRKHEWNRVIEETPFQFPTTQTLQVYLNSVFAMVSEIFENLIENDFRISGAKKEKIGHQKAFNPFSSKKYLFPPKQI